MSTKMILSEIRFVAEPANEKRYASHKSVGNLSSNWEAAFTMALGQIRALQELKVEIASVTIAATDAVLDNEDEY